MGSFHLDNCWYWGKPPFQVLRRTWSPGFICEGTAPSSVFSVGAGVVPCGHGPGLPSELAAKILASVLQCGIEIWRQSFGCRIEKSGFYCFASLRRSPKASTLKTVPSLGKNRKGSYSSGGEGSATGEE